MSNPEYQRVCKLAADRAKRIAELEAENAQLLKDYGELNQLFSDYSMTDVAKLEEGK
jgi:hypothetical protein